MPLTVERKKLFLVDGSNLAFRAHFAIQGDMRSPDGQPTRALFGFAAHLQRMRKEHAPEYMLVVFDKGKSFRNDIYPDYKGQRPDMPEDLRQQWPEMEPFAEELGFCAMAIEGVEADDIIGTLAHRFAGPELEVHILSSDKDFCQLVNQDIKVLDPGKDQLLGRDEVMQRWGVPPEKIIDLLSLMGDTSDNVPGVPGVGEKKAAKFIDTYGSADAVIANADKIGGKTGIAIKEAKDAVALARRLVTIVVDIPIERSLEDLRLREPNWQALIPRLKRYGFRTLLKAAEAAAAQAGAHGSADASGHSSAAGSPKAGVDRSIYKTITSEAELLTLANELRRAGRFAFDTETTSLDAAHATLVGMSFCWADDKAVYVPVAHTRGPNVENALSLLAPLLADPMVGKIGQNLKYDLQVIRANGADLQGIVGDTMLLDYLVEVEQRHGLDDLARRYLDHTNIAYEEVTRAVGGRFAEVPVEEATTYAAEDAHVAFLIDKAIQASDSLDPDLRRLYDELEVPLIPVLAAMETAGIRVDREKLGELSIELARRIEAITERVHQEAGEVFNLNSPKQLATILFEKRGLEPIKKTKTGPSTAADVLETLAEQGDALCALLLEYRELAKLKSTYVDALPEAIGPDGRIHTSFHQAVAATGRLSSNEPNLQNIPIRTEEGRRIRAAFVPDPGMVFLSADYSQIELRVLAHFCGRGTLVEAFQAGEDIHRRTAAEIFSIHPGLVTNDQRRAAKAINFGLVYGMSAFRLANELKIPRRLAQEWMDGYFARYPEVKGFMATAIEQAKETGFARTLDGRRRPVRGLDARNPNERGSAERIAINTPVQGTAADLIKRAMIAVHAGLAGVSPRARLLLQVHDELVLEVPEADAAAVGTWLKATMEQVATLAVPLVVDWKTGNNWDQAH